MDDASDAVAAAVRRALDAHRGEEGALLPILHAVQGELGHVPPAALPAIASALNLSRAEVHGVVTYYHDFRERPAGRRHLRVCAAESCQALGGEALLDGARAALGCSEAEPTSADGAWTVEPVYCLGLCAVSPAAELDGRPLGRLTGAWLGEVASARSEGHADPCRREARSERAVTPTSVPSATPAMPATPATPATPAMPATPATPATPAMPATPATPATPAMPARPARPATAAIARVCVPGDSAAVAVGADAVADAFAARGAAVVRTSSRGLAWLEPLVEIERDAVRVGFARCTPGDAAAVLAGPPTTDPPAADADAGWIGPVEAIPFLARQQRLTFARAGVGEPLSLADYAAHGGWRGLRAAAAAVPADVRRAVLDSGLRGRGGAAFPAGIKWRTVGEAAAARKHVVCNADEGDSGTYADRMVMEGDPYLLIEGMAIAGIACGAASGVVYVRSEYPAAIRTLREAIVRARAAGFLGDDVAGSGRTFELAVRVGAGSYVCGEETAMLESIEGRRGLVRAKPPVPALSGLFGRPTLIQNVLTFAAVPWILVHGAAAYAALGSGRSTGTMPFQLAGDVRRAGLVELPFGVTLRELVLGFGGGTASGRPVKAIQVGGPLGTYLPESRWDEPMAYEAYAAFGGVLGHGGIVVHDDTADLARLARFAMRFCAIESCGKCTPCRIGSVRGVETIDRLLAAPDRAGRAREAALLEDLCDTMTHGSLCAMGGMTPYPVRSAMAHWPEDFGLAPVVSS